MEFGTASGPELLWMAMVIATQGAHIYAGRDAWLDLRALKRARRDGLLTFAARGHLWMSIMLATLQLREGYFGLRSLLTPNQSPQIGVDTVLELLSPALPGELTVDTVTRLLTPAQTSGISLDALVSVVIIFAGEALLMSLSLGAIWFRRELRRKREAEFALLRRGV